MAYEMSAQLKKLLDKREKLDEKRLALKTEAAELASQINALLAEEQADAWGLSVEEYAAAKKEANPAADAEREYHAALTQHRKWNARFEDKRKDDTFRRAAQKEANALAEKLPELEEKLRKLETERKPLHVVLNKYRAKKMKELRNAQTAKATAANVGTTAK